MEKRLVVFLVIATLVMVGWMALTRALFPPPPRPAVVDEGEGPPAGDAAEGPEKPSPPGDGTKPPSDQPPPDGDAQSPQVGQDQTPPEQPAEDEPTTPGVPPQWVSRGSADPSDPYRILVTFNNRGAAVERIELSDPQFRDLDRTGYMGHLALQPRDDGPGLAINVVGRGTPAANAICQTKGIPKGLKKGDVLLEVGPLTVMAPEEVDDFLQTTRPGQQLSLTVLRPVDEGPARSLKFTVDLRWRPLDVVAPEYSEIRDRYGRVDPAKVGLPREQQPLSYLTTIAHLGAGVGAAGIERGESEIEGLPSLFKRHWEVVEDRKRLDELKELLWPDELKDPQRFDEVVFVTELSSAELEPLGARGPLEIIKRFRIPRVPPDEQQNENYRAYHLDYDLVIRNLGDQPQLLAYRQQGPTGMPLEGWWYSNKIHPRFGSSAGTRDVIFSLEDGPHKGFNLIGCRKIVKQFTKEPDDPDVQLYRSENAAPLRYMGGDAQYFSSVLMPRRDGAEAAETAGYDFPEAYAFVVGEVDPINAKRTDNTFRITSRPVPVTRDKPLHEQFVIFAGPKSPAILAEYGLDDTIVYGWFAWIAKPMLKLLHFFYFITFEFSYGLAILMLTVLVRACMFPLSRKQVRSAQKMQELAPEMKKLAEKYKDDMQKKAAAQQELFRKHNYNPLGGCLLVFVQLPIFIGLYRCLSVDISLRLAPLIPGMTWCDNLAGPDQLWHWEHAFWPMLDFLVGPNGYLGPYLNILPLFTIVLFLMQQKMFTPPATDDQQKMQQQVMTFMMLFIGVLFFRVPSGLCLYFIASSLWGVTERKLLPRATPSSETPAAAAKTAEKIAEKKARRKKARARR